MKTVKITISAKGESKIDLVGFHGQGCSEIMNALTAGDKDVTVEEKSEFWESETENERERNAL